MGYPMMKKDSQFVIKKENKEKALKAIKSLIGQETCQGDHFACVNDFKNLTTLEEVLEEWRWETIKDENDNIIDINFIGEKFGDDIVLFSKIAPFVESNSFIQMMGGDGTYWKWVFEDGKCQEIEPISLHMRWWLGIKK